MAKRKDGKTRIMDDIDFRGGRAVKHQVEIDRMVAEHHPEFEVPRSTRRPPAMGLRTGGAKPITSDTEG